MKKSIFLLSFILISIFLFAQEESEYKEPSKESQAYHNYRIYQSTPPYGLSKVNGLIKKIKFEDSPDGESEGKKALDNKTYNALSLREKFTYVMIHGEAWSQICDAMPMEQDEQKKIYGNLPDLLGEYSWSNRQKDFLKSNRDSVMAMIKESVTRSKRMGVNYKKAAEEINAKELIPFLVSFYNEKKKDGDILTLLMLLMKMNNYEPLIKSASYEKLYGDEYNYNSSIVYNKANEELIIQRATDFYHGLAKK